MSDGAGGGSTDDATTPAPAARSVTTSAGTTSIGGDSERATSAPSRSSPSERRRAKREAYWNRPKPPKDWRYWVGGLGRVLIVLGLLMFAFVGYQLWGTGIEEARAQDRLESELTEQQASLGTVPVLIPATTSEPPSTTAPPASGPEPTTPPSTVAPITQPPTLSLPPIEEGDPIGILLIPRIDVEKQIVAGVTVADLKTGPGHFPQTPMPGELGNAAIAGHRTTFGGPFLHLDELEVGDEIVFTNLYSQEFVYRVTGTEVVDPSDGHVINTTDPGIATLTLVTCTPVRTSEQRLIINATLDATASPAPTATQRYYGQEGDAITELPGEDVTETSTVESSAPPESAAPTTTSAAAIPVRPAGFSDADPFSAGWFSDSGAWPHVFAWGLALAAVCGGSYLLARSLRRRWVGWVVGALPFTFLLYFFFQNVNRLLPPGL